MDHHQVISAANAAMRLAMSAILAGRDAETATSVEALTKLNEALAVVGGALDGKFSDGRPFSADEFIGRLVSSGAYGSAVSDALRAWNEGAWSDAVFPLDEEATDALR